MFDHFYVQECLITKKELNLLLLQVLLNFKDLCLIRFITLSYSKKIELDWSNRRSQSWAIGSLINHKHWRCHITCNESINLWFIYEKNLSFFTVLFNCFVCKLNSQYNCDYNASWLGRMRDGSVPLPTRSNATQF